MWCMIYVQDYDAYITEQFSVFPFSDWDLDAVQSLTWRYLMVTWYQPLTFLL